jgi:hypothetical protein
MSISVSVSMSILLYEYVDNHASILLSFKNTREIRKKSSCDLEATVGLDRGRVIVHRTAFRQESYNQQFLWNTPTQLLKNSSGPHHILHLPPPE